MAYLDWSNSLKKMESFISSEGEEIELKLSLNSDQIEALSRALDEIQTGENLGELKLILAQGWLIFWKLRKEGSRFLLAHPEEEQWVATLALSSGDFQTVILALRNLLIHNMDKVDLLQSVSFPRFGARFHLGVVLNAKKDF